MNNRYKAIILFLGFITLAFVGCSKNQLKDAFKGKLSPVEGNKVVTEYCQSCHVHKSFDPNNHVTTVPSFYSKEEFSTAIECHQCHTLDVDFWGEEKQGTHYPVEIN